jgi:DNA-directed RNA polymerase specialized sigma24 family protein
MGGAMSGCFVSGFVWWDEQVAEDLISEVFLVVWRQAGKFKADPRFPPGSWR